MRHTRFAKVLLLSLFAACIIAARAAALQIPSNIPSWKSVPPKTLAKLCKYGELIAVDNVGGNVEMISVGMVADVPPEKFWKTITDFEGYTNLLPGTLKTTVIKEGKNTADVRFEVTVLKFSVINITTKYVLRYKLEPMKRAEISWVEGDVKNVAGYWQLYPLDGGKRTFAIYAITSDLASASPIVGSALAEQPATVMAINLSSAIVFVRKVMEKATGKALPAAPAGSQPVWRTMDQGTLYKLMAGGRVGFISRIGKQEIATSAVLVRKKRDQVWKYLVDFEKYPGKIQQIVSAKVIEQNDKQARVQMKTAILALGPIKIATSGVNFYKFEKPSKMSVVDDPQQKKKDKKKPRADLFNRWELLSFKGGAETGLFNETVSDISDMGSIAKIMLERLPNLQISIDLSQAMIMSNAIRKWADGK